MVEMLSQTLNWTGESIVNLAKAKTVFLILKLTKPTAILKIT